MSHVQNTIFPICVKSLYFNISFNSRNMMNQLLQTFLNKDNVKKTIALKVLIA